MILTHNGTRLTVGGSGLYVALPARLHGYASVTEHAGVDRDLNGTWNSRDSWDHMSFAGWMDAPENDFRQWLLTGDNVTRAADVGTPLIPHNSGPGGEHTPEGRATWSALLEAASGTRDGVYTSMGAALATKGPDTVYARIWWEMNQYPASVDATKFIAAWNHAIPLIRAGFAGAARVGQTLKIVYCPMASGTNRWTYLPDLAHVDVLALDLYAGLYGTTLPTESAVLAYTASMLAELTARGQTHGKPLALGEWGNWAPGTVGVEETHGLGDSPAFIDQVADWVAAENVEYVCYFDFVEGGVGQTLADTPNSLARLAARFPG